MRNLACLSRTIGRVALAAGLTLAVLATTVSAQKEPDPVPKDQGGELSQPKPLTVKPIDAPASLPPGQKLGFALDTGGKAQTGNWDVTGTVVENARGRLTLRTASGEEGHLLYRLPEGQDLPARPGQPVTIKRAMTIVGSRLAYDLHISSGDDMILAASRQFRNAAPKDAAGASRLFTAEGMPADPLRSMAFWGNAERKEALKSTRYTNIYKVPINVKSLVPGQANAGVKTLAGGESTSLPVDDKSYAITVTESREVVPKPEYKGVVEGSGYTLEYVVSKRPQP